MSQSPSGPRHHILYQHRVRSDFPLWGVECDDSEYDFEFLRADTGATRPFDPSPQLLRYENPSAGVELYEDQSTYCLRYPGIADFVISEARRVGVHVEPGASESLVVSLLQGPVCALLLELRGIICLHASAVQIGDRAVAFLGHTGAGKSSFAMHFVSRGMPLVTDDILPLKIDGNVCRVLPGFPQIKLRPDGLTKAHFDPHLQKHLLSIGRQPSDLGSFAQLPCPISLAYLLHREPESGTAVRIEPIGPSESMVELLRHSFCARAVGALALEARRFDQIADLCHRISIWSLCFPAGVEHLATSCDAVFAGGNCAKGHPHT